MKALPTTLAILAILLGASACSTTETPAPAAPPGHTEIHPNADQQSRDLAEREMLRREQDLENAIRLIEEGDRNRAEGNLEDATRDYERSLRRLR